MARELNKRGIKNLVSILEGTDRLQRRKKYKVKFDIYSFADKSDKDHHIRACINGIAYMFLEKDGSFRRKPNMDIKAINYDWVREDKRGQDKPTKHLASVLGTTYKKASQITHDYMGLAGSVGTSMARARRLLQYFQKSGGKLPDPCSM